MPGTYRFKWPHASADEVIVTGTFDNWAKSITLDKKAWAHEKTVEIPDTKDEILYKFVVNGQWRTDPSHATKRDHEGNENNILDPEDIIPVVGAGAGGTSGGTAAGIAGAGGSAAGGSAAGGSAAGGSAAGGSAAGGIAAGVVGGAAIATVGAGATTLGLAGAQPIEDKSTMPGAFPTTPMEGGPLPTLQDRVVGVNPIPATEGIGNPVHLQPGEKVPDPSTLTDNTIGSTVTTDKASYESGGNGAAYAPAGKVDDSAAHFGRPAAGGTKASTLALAGKQPIQPRGTPTVEKKTDDGIAGKAAAGVAVAGVATAGAAVAANQFIKDKTGKDPVSALPQSAQDTIHQNAKDSNLPAQATGADRETASSVPKEVTESQKEANRPPEAAANETAVQEKSQAEKELLSKVPESNAQGAPAPTATAATAATVPSTASGANAPGAPAPTAAAPAAAAATVPTTTSNSGAPQLGKPTAVGMAPISMDDKPSDANVAALKASSMPNQHPRVAAEGTSATTTPQKRQSMVDRLKTPKSEAGKSDAGSSEPSTPTSKKRQSFMSRMKEKIKNL